MNHVQAFLCTDAQTAASGAFCGTLLPVTKPETVTGFVQLLTSKWRARDLSQVVNQHAKQDSSPSDVHSSTAPNEFDQAVVRILYAGMLRCAKSPFSTGVFADTRMIAI